MNRWLVFVGAAVALWWQSNCLSYENNVIFNRCGLMQWVVGRPMTIGMGEIQKIVVEKEKVITMYRDAARSGHVPTGDQRGVVVTMPMSASSSVSFYPSTATATVVMPSYGGHGR